jgi:hypothetical protein
VTSPPKGDEGPSRSIVKLLRPLPAEEVEDVLLGVECLLLGAPREVRLTMGVSPVDGDEGDSFCWR